MNERQLKPFRKRMQTIFQDPYSSLNPGMNVLQIISEPMEIHNYGSKAEMKGRAYDLMNRVGLKPEHAERYPHEFSGGQRQRISIARALSVNPEFILCDEPLSALDVSVQAQVVNMLEDLQAEMGLTYLFIAHDLSMVRHISNRIGVMYRGKLVEVAPTEELYRNPVHPYTQALLAAIPVPDPSVRNEMPPIYSGDTDPSARRGMKNRNGWKCRRDTLYPDIGTGYNWVIILASKWMNRKVRDDEYRDQIIPKYGHSPGTGPWQRHV